MPRSSRPLLGIVVVAGLVAWGHRAWLSADPCGRMSFDQLESAPGLAMLAYRQELQRQALLATHASARAGAQLQAGLRGQADVIAQFDGAYPAAITALAQRQRAEFDQACRAMR